MSFKEFRFFVGLVGLALIITSCSTVPVTGRKQLDLVSDETIVKQSIGMFEQMKHRTPISRNGTFQDTLQRVGDRISQQVFWDMPMAEWEFVVFDQPEINAFAMPGGKVGVYTGIFKLCENDDQLASVIAHEISHVTARHTHERVSQQMMTRTGGNALSMVGVGSLGALVAKEVLQQVYTTGSAKSAVAWDRAKEGEADEIGIMYMARAGYDPQAAIDVMEKMVRIDMASGKGDPWYSTHPSSVERLNALHGYLEEAKAEYDKVKDFEF